ncbi:unnamed protein product [Soboliphyme baturini]|uniref:Pyr_redox_dim domain-containing protein n=1 Tax=Soboliphyme baturini TaxID=241478 RepID=A0A183IZF1_9BILA|nr:unnamed protein product [Soboliphyme baturini]
MNEVDRGIPFNTVKWITLVVIKGEAVEQAEKFKYLGVVFTSGGKCEEEIDWRIGAASGALCELARIIAIKQG